MTALPAPSSRYDLATPEGRRRANANLLWGDHGFLRLRFRNFHWIEPGKMARANQPSPAHLKRYRDEGFKTIINLRGPSDTGYYALEREACAKLGLTLIDAPHGSREAPKKERIHHAKTIFETIEYPALMHCKSGADRAGIMAVFYKHFHMGAPIAEALDQLSLKYLHVKAGKTGMLDFFFETYLAQTAESKKSFLQWVDEDYDPEAVRRAFRAQWWGTILTEGVLRRE
jgi:protein tyrosine/serine phosphatase